MTTNDIEAAKPPFIDADTKENVDEGDEELTIWAPVLARGHYVSSGRPGAHAVDGPQMTEGEDHDDHQIVYIFGNDHQDAHFIEPVEDHLPPPDTTLVSAVRVDDDMKAERAEIEAELREKLRQEAVEANVVEEQVQQQPQPPLDTHRQRNLLLLLGFAVGLVGLAVLLGVFLRPTEDAGSNSNNEVQSAGTEPTFDTRPTLEVVRERGFLRCAVYDAAIGFSKPNPQTGELEGINIDQVSEDESLSKKCQIEYTVTFSTVCHGMDCLKLTFICILLLPCIFVVPCRFHGCVWRARQGRDSYY